MLNKNALIIRGDNEVLDEIREDVEKKYEDKIKVSDNLYQEYWLTEMYEAVFDMSGKECSREALLEVFMENDMNMSERTDFTMEYNILEDLFNKGEDE